MLTKERRRLLLEEIARTGRVVTSDFAGRYGVSDVTVRADLDHLQTQGRISRTHGGAVAADATGPIEEFDDRLSLNRRAKQRIALAAAKYVTSNQTVLLDSGTTVHHLAQSITDLSGLTVYTPALPAAQHLMRTHGVEVRLLGGRIMPSWLQTVGTSRELGLKGVIVDTLFLGTQGVDDDLDIVDHEHELVATKQRMIRRARRVIVLLDGSKWSVSGRLKVLNLAQVDVIITDAQPPARILERLEGRVEIVIA